MVFLQNLVETTGFTNVFPPNFPHAMRQPLVLPLVKPGILQANIMRHACTLAAVGAEVMRITCLMNSWCARMLELLGGKLAAIMIMEVEPKEFDFDGNLDNEL